MTTMPGKSSTTVNTNTVPEDPKIVSLMAEQHDTTVAYVNQPAAESVSELSATESRYEDTAILDYINAVDPETLTNAGGQPDYNYDVMSGVTYDIDISKPAGSRIVNLLLDPAQEVVVAVNNYRRSGGGGFPHVSAAPVVYNAQVEIRQALIDYAQAAGVIDESEFFVPNWRLVREGVPVF
jgi:2',3'-cyclic-nucleotide 2'-phosphodiesterase (5'-nucleotidase family)